ncbi:MAG: prepilin-type N-terminal cleavage/methylation domain-containing protein [Pirellulales bacterium]|nr:prepilin-type N-terminal cleavage/methylation domain-containing protein [Pirellulales bacterium]
MSSRTARPGFSLVELVVVILIMGIIAAVAAPKMFDTATTARENSTRQSLLTLRDAIELYKAQNNSYPPAAISLATNLRPFLKGPFPPVQCGPNLNALCTETSQDPITTPAVSSAGWVYNPATGDISVNAAAYIAW